MALHVLSAALQGIEAKSVHVQIDSSPGIHTFSIVGLPDKAVQESQDRVNAAIRNSGFTAPQSQNRKYTINLSPADLKKEGALFDLPIAIAYLLESGQLSANTADTLFAGELALDGTLCHIKGAFSLAVFAKEQGYKTVIVPQENSDECSFVGGIAVIGAKTLQDVVQHYGAKPLAPVTLRGTTLAQAHQEDSFAYIKGQSAAKRALVVAAAGGHNILMQGPPGSGKTLLAKSLIGLLPPLSHEETLQAAKIHSSAGVLNTSPAAMERPFRSPHHTSSPAAIVGGGAWPRPGEISLAHRGILFLDEFPEFARNVLESLREPLEENLVTISRASGSLQFPASFLLVAAMNPCPCGNHGEPRLSCSCGPTQIMRYRKKISGPLLDRIDIQINVPRETVRFSGDSANMDSLSDARTAVAEARGQQEKRLSQHGIITNSEVSFKKIEALCPLNDNAKNLLERAVNQQNLSQRAAQKARKVARTIADLAGSDLIEEPHVAEALSLRLQTQSLFA